MSSVEPTPERTPIVEAIAEHFACDFDDVGRWAVICERDTPDGPVSSSAWALVPHWQMLGLVDELRTHIEQGRTHALPQTNGRAT